MHRAIFGHICCAVVDFQAGDRGRLRRPQFCGWIRVVFKVTAAQAETDNLNKQWRRERCSIMANLVCQYFQLKQQSNESNQANEFPSLLLNSSSSNECYCID